MDKFERMIVVLAVCLLASSCRTEKQANDALSDFGRTEEARAAQYFSQVVADAACNVYFTQAEKPSVKVVGAETDVKKIETGYDGDQLYIKSVKGTKKNSGKNRKGVVDVYIASPDLTDIAIRGVGDFEVQGKLNTDTLDVQISGVGGLDVPDLICNHVDVCARGVGDVDIDNAVCHTANFTIQGVGNVDVNLVKTERTNIIVKGVGSMDVNFDGCDWASCTLSGIGSITTTGTLKTLEKRKKGGLGSIDTDDLDVGRIVK